jgi:hypothetical protein
MSEVRNVQITGGAVDHYRKERAGGSTHRKRKEYQDGGDVPPGGSITGAANISAARAIQNSLARGGAAAAKKDESVVIRKTHVPSPSVAPTASAKAEPKPEPKPEAKPKAVATGKPPAKMEGKDEKAPWYLKVTAEPGTDIQSWVSLVVDMTKMGLEQVGSEADIMKLFTLNRVIFDRLKAEDEVSHKALMAEFKNAKEK